MLTNYFKIAWRNLYRNKTTTLINLCGLSIGMTAAVLILFWVQNEKSFDLFHPKSDHIYRVTNTINVNAADTWTWETSPLPMAEAAEKEIPEVERSANLQLKENAVLNIGNHLFTEDKAAYVGGKWFDMFKYDFISGDPIAFSKDPFSIILTETKAKKYFGDVSAVGKTIVLENKNYTVQAVIQNNPTNSSFQFDMLMPMEAFLSDTTVKRNDWGGFGYITFLRLRQDAKTSAVTKKLNSILVRNKKNHQVVSSLLPLRDIYFEQGRQTSSLLHGNKKTTDIFSALAILLLVTACINYVNLTTAKASLRAKEISIRKIAGARRGSLYYQFMVESIIISLVALFISLVLIQLSLPAFNALTGKQFLLPLTSMQMWKVLIATFLVSTLLNGIYPAAMLSSFKPMQVFRGKSMLKVKDTSVRKALVIFQFGLSTMLIIGVFIIYKQLQFLQQTNPGYNTSQVISLEIPFETYTSYSDEQRKTFFPSLKNELKSQGGVSGVSLVGSPIVGLNSISSGNADWDGRDKNYNPSIVPYSADADFVQVLGLEMKFGRWFRAGTNDKNRYILNETAIKQLNIHKPVIGQRFSWGGEQGEIIGIVKDFHYQSMHQKIAPMVINTTDGTGLYLYIKTSPGNPEKALRAIENTWKKFFPAQPFTYTFLDDTFNTVYKDDIKISRIIFIFSLITILISALGLFGLATFTAQQRTKEIGVRKVLGASVASITALLSKDFIKLVILAIILACPVAWYFMNRWLLDFAYRIEIRWWMFVLTALLAIVVAGLTISLQTIKAALANPVKSLRME